MNYLLDTNIWLELMLDQERAADIADLLTRVPSDQLCLTDFSLHSIGVILTRLKQSHIFIRFVQDVLIDGSALLVTVPPNEAAALVNSAEKFDLDFDDAYQYVAAKRHDLTIVSLDRDFDRTDLIRRTPVEIIQTLDSDPDAKPEEE